MRRSLHAVIAVLLSVACIDAALGLFSPVAVTQMTARGVGDAQIGLLSSLYVGFFGGTWFAMASSGAPGKPARSASSLC